MGNEASSVRIHSALTAEDLKGLRHGFPGGGNGPPPARLHFGPWNTCWRPEDRAQLERILLEKSKKGGGGAAATNKEQEDGISFYAYQDLAGSVVRGTTEARVKLLFRMLDRSPDKAVTSKELIGFAARVAQTAGKIISDKKVDGDDESLASSDSLAKALVHELVFPGETAKSCFLKDPPLDLYLDFDAIERWMVMKCPLFEQIFLFALASSFGLPLSGGATEIPKPPLVPLTGINWEETRLTPQDVVFLNSQIPADFRKKWRPLFNARVHGENFSKFSSSAINKGPSIVIVWEKDGFVFGGFNSDSWRLGPKFFGQPSCFLFHLRPRAQQYETARFNSNYAYFNLKQKTMPNGMGFGGQLDYFGLWLGAEDYGRGKSAPSCSSYQSPQLSKVQDFEYEHLELWGLGEEPDLGDQGSGRSALDMDPEAQAMMEMMGKTFVSKDVKAADEQLEKEEQEKERQQQQ